MGWRPGRSGSGQQGARKRKGPPKRASLGHPVARLLHVRAAVGDADERAFADAAEVALRDDGRASIVHAHVDVVCTLRLGVVLVRFARDGASDDACGSRDILVVLATDRVLGNLFAFYNATEAPENGAGGV